MPAVGKIFVGNSTQSAHLVIVDVSNVSDIFSIKSTQMLSSDQNILVRPDLPIESWLTNKLSLDSQSAFTAPPHSVPKVSNVSAIFAICRGQQELQTSHYNNFSCCRNQALHWIFSQLLNLNCSYISPRFTSKNWQYSEAMFRNTLHFLDTLAHFWPLSIFPVSLPVAYLRVCNIFSWYFSQKKKQKLTARDLAAA